MHHLFRKSYLLSQFAEDQIALAFQRIFPEASRQERCLAFRERHLILPCFYLDAAREHCKAQEAVLTAEKMRFAIDVDMVRREILA